MRCSGDEFSRDGMRVKACTRYAGWLMLGLLGTTTLGCSVSKDGEPAPTAAPGVNAGGNAAGGAAAEPPSNANPNAATAPLEPAAATGNAMGTPEQPSADLPLASSGSMPAPTSSAKGGGTNPAAPSASSPDAAAPVGSTTDTAACPSNANAAPGETTESLTIGGQTRSYLLHVPPSYTGDKPVPVVFDFHGLGGTGAQQRTLSGWAAVADREGFIMVYPNGTSNAWNVGRCCPPAADQGVDDVGFVRAILAQLETKACVDSKRIYASGCSNGGGMSYELACKAADVIAAVAPVDFDCVVGPDNVPSCGGCNPGRPISEIQFRATGDQLVAYNGGPAPIPQGMDFPGAQQNFSDWGTINACTGTPEQLTGHAVCQTFPSCGSGVETTLCTRQGGSHCGNYAALDIANVAWEQFQRAALP